MTIERTYTVPLRSAFSKVPQYYRTNKAMSAPRAFLRRHLKVKDEQIKIGQHLNALIWAHGIRNPPPRVTIHVVKSDAGIVTAELEGKEYKASVKPKAKTEEPKSLKDRLAKTVKKEEKPEPAAE